MLKAMGRIRKNRKRPRPRTIEFVYEDLQGHVSSIKYEAVKKIIGTDRVWLSCFVDGERFESEELKRKPSGKKVNEFMLNTMEMVAQSW